MHVCLLLPPPKHTHADYQVLTTLCGDLKETAVLVVKSICTQVLHFFVSIVTMLLLLLAGDVEKNPGPGESSPSSSVCMVCSLALMLRHLSYCMSVALESMQHCCVCQQTTHAIAYRGGRKEVGITCQQSNYNSKMLNQCNIFC